MFKKRATEDESNSGGSTVEGQIKPLIGVADTPRPLGLSRSQLDRHVRRSANWSGRQSQSRPLPMRTQVKAHVPDENMS